MEIAKEILNQLGGNKFIVMTGAKNLVAHESGLSFKLPTKKHYTKNNINYVKIILTPMDLYDIEYGTIKKFNYKVKETASGIYADMLQETFTKTTGLDTSL